LIVHPWALAVLGLSACDGGTSVDTGDAPANQAVSDETGAVDSAIPLPSCSNGLDDDGDGWIDADDPDCVVSDRESGLGSGACNDGLDNDGDGRIDAADPECGSAMIGSEAPVRARASLDDAYAEIQVETIDDRLEAGAAPGDLDGDGRDEFAVRVFPGGASSYVQVLGDPGPGRTALSAAGSAVRVAGEEVGAFVGAPGDLDADGVPDLVGGWWGALFVIPGLAWEGGAIAEAASVIGKGVGRASSRAGDTNGDGVGDLWIGSYTDPDPGGVYLFRGPLLGENTLADADLELRGDDPGANAGWDVAGGMDVDGDGIDDLAGSTTWATDATGTVTVLFGPFDGDRPLSDADAVLTGSILAGDLLDSGDVDGDGRADLVVLDDTWSGCGAVFVTVGVPRTGALQDVAATLLAETAWAMFGAGDVVFVGDVDADGFGDVLVGAPFEGHFLADAGAAYVARGPFEGVVDLAEAALAIDGPEVDGGLGGSVAAAGDVDGDGRSDFVLGGLWSENPDSPAAAYLFLGGDLF
jgi:hypothetical protein